MKVTEAIARTLVAEGAEVVFSLLGDTNMELVVQLAELGLPVHESRHESTAMAMADGYARASGRVAICSTTAGPGLTHTLVPMLSAARRTPSPVVVLTGPHSRDALDNRQAVDHEEIARIACAHYRPVASPGVVVERTRSVVDLALTDGKPVVFDIPGDVQQAEYPWDLDDRAVLAWREPQRVQPDPKAVDAAVRVIEDSGKPIVLAGGGATSAEAHDELSALAQQCGAILATTINARARFHGDRFNAGIAGLFSLPAAAELFTEADCVISFGASLNGHTTENGYLFPAARFVQVDIRPPAPMEDGQAADCYVQGDAVPAARAIRAALPPGPREGFRTEETAKALQSEVDSVAFDIEPGRVDQRHLCANLDALLPENCGLVSGAAHYWSFPQMHMFRWREPLLYANYFGSIGYSIPVGLGASLATGRSTLVFEGDGGFMMNPHTIETAVRTSAHLLIVVMNDHMLGAEFHKLRARGLDPSLAVSPEPDIAAIARQMGCASAVLTDLDQLPDMVHSFVSGDGPFVVDARVSRNVISIPYRRAYYGTE